MMSRTGTFALTLVVAFAVAAALVFTSRHSFSTMPAAAEILGRGIALFAMGWAVAGIAYLVSGRRLQRETLAWIVGIAVVASAVLLRLGDF
jgi:hypothetical protein